MFYAAFIDAKGERQANLYHSYGEYFNDTFSPDTKYLCSLEFKVRGKSYAEKKEYVRSVAIEFQNVDSEVSGGLSYSEYAEVGEWFNRYGRRYGLLTEFRENAIC